MPSIGIVINPESGRDIRRIVGKASFVTSYMKIDVIKRFLLGLDSTSSVDEVIFMPDFYGISFDIINEIKDNVSFELSTIDMKVENSANDTINAARYMVNSGIDMIVSAGGDGTLRAVYKGAGDKVPILGLSLGTNNVLGASYEPTVLGIMLGLLVRNINPDVIDKTKTIKILVNDEFRDLALVDLTLVDGWYIGAKAIWDEYSLRYAFISKGELGDIGIPSIASFIKPIGFQDDFGLMIEFGIGNRINAILAPGLVKQVFIKEIKTLRVGQEISIPSGNYVVAFDGEKEMVVNSNDEIKIKIDRDGPFLINVPRALSYISSYYKKGGGEIEWVKKY
ncbi:NAD(+)/NADH kinase [Sulfolobus tengchongensis]|uniref:NAD(+)/NADH kinase n=1 Tax=Sulfolobus tengchongensis TaxID=207809 RepID=A0AAX4L4U3_9CREN